jgi:hypothetical protein
VIFRFVAAAALLSAALLVFAYLHLIGRGPLASPESRHLRAMKERTAEPDSFATFAFADFARLPHGRALATYAPLERRGVRLEGCVAGMLHASDDDLHLEISAGPRRAGDRETLYVTGEITSAFRARHPAWRYEPLRQVLRPASSIEPSFDRPTTRVRVSGWLLYDYQYDGLESEDDAVRALWNRFNPQRRTPYVARRSTWPRLTGWEIHPVTGLEVWDDSLRTWRRLGA